jgi:hypothetical protein
MTVEKIKELEEKILTEEKYIYEFNKEVYENVTSIDEVMVLPYVVADTIFGVVSYRLVDIEATKTIAKKRLAKEISRLNLL